MPNWSAVYNTIRRAPRPEVRRALDATAGTPIPRPTLKQRLILKSMDKIKALLSSWLFRRLLASLISAGAVLGVDESDTKGAAAFLTALVLFLYELVQKFVRAKYLKIKPADAAPLLPARRF